MFKFLQRTIKLAVACTVVLFLSCCNGHLPNNGIVAHIKSKPLSSEEFELFWRAQHLDSARITQGIKHNVYLPADQNCGSEIPVFDRLNFDYAQIEESLKNEDALKSLLTYTATLYKLIAEPVTLGGSPKVGKNINYNDRGLSCKNMFDSLSTGAWFFDCGGHAEMAKVFLDSLGNGKYVTKIAQLSRRDGQEVNHVVALVYYRQNEQWYGIALDCQNGTLCPVKNGRASIPAIAEQKALLGLNQTDSFGIAFIPEPDLHRKRNLMDNAFYCNVLPDTQNQYHLAYPQSGYKYERLTYSMLYYSWFKGEVINTKKYTQDMVSLLVKNAPQ